ncbi:hypothetical protein A2U01_0031909 [Trifolium medium]|uniref:Uncharacterized protein n=1 Tax=Trifolium medium TaxID=97028 RepID=A0A392PG96_9FABA|nr:hypothetical protein [Trifolium medium]
MQLSQIREEHDVGSGVEFEEEKKEDKEKVVEENLNADEEEEDKDEPVKEVEHEEKADGIRAVGEVIPPDAELAITDKDTVAGEIASDIAPLRTKKRTKRGQVVRQASADVSVIAFPEPTASAQEKNDQDVEAEVSKPETKKRKPKVHAEGTRKSSRHKA